MNINITLRLNPADYGKSGDLAVCVFCAKATEYKICCDSYKGLLSLTNPEVTSTDEDFSYIDYLTEEYSFTREQRTALVQALIKFHAEKENA